MQYLLRHVPFQVLLVIAVLGSLDDHPDSFWLTAELLNVEWRKGCLTTAGCAEPRFQITEVNSANNEAVSISWPVTLKLVEDGSQLFISHWITGNIYSIDLKCEVAGLDPTYGFPRICDSTALHRIFKEEGDDLQSVHLRSLKNPSSSKQTGGKIILEVKGKCFNASLASQHYEKCPTCSQQQSIAVVEQYAEPEVGSDFFRHANSSDQLFYALLVVTAFGAILSAGFACLLIAFLHQRRYLKSSSSKQLLRNEHISTSNPLQVCHEDSRYEVPWERMQMACRRPPYRCFDSRNAFTTLSTIGMSPSALGPVSDTNKSGKSERKTSPSSSFGERRDDSGLESV